MRSTVGAGPSKLTRVRPRQSRHPWIVNLPMWRLLRYRRMYKWFLTRQPHWADPVGEEHAFASFCLLEELGVERVGRMMEGLEPWPQGVRIIKTDDDFLLCPLK